MQKVHSMECSKDYFMNSRLQQLQKELQAVIEGMSTEDLLRHPAGNQEKWNAAMILEHLTLSYTGTTKGMERCLAAGRPLARAATLRDRMRALVVVGFKYLPEGRQAPERTRPTGIDPNKIRAEFGQRIEGMDAAISACEQRYGHSAKLIDHPVIGPLNGSQWRKFHCVHGRHHIKQIQRLRGLR
jgi:hypothetical protein